MALNADASPFAAISDNCSQREGQVQKSEWLVFDDGGETAGRG